MARKEPTTSITHEDGAEILIDAAKALYMKNPDKYPNQIAAMVTMQNNPEILKEALGMLEKIVSPQIKI